MQTPNSLLDLHLQDTTEGIDAASEALACMALATEAAIRAEIFEEAIANLIDLPLTFNNLEATQARLQGFATIMAEKLADRTPSAPSIALNATAHDASCDAALDYPVAAKAIPEKSHDRPPILCADDDCRTERDIGSTGGDYALYSALKMNWESQNPEATPTEHQIAIDRIARESGV